MLYFIFKKNEDLYLELNFSLRKLFLREILVFLLNGIISVNFKKVKNIKSSYVNSLLKLFGNIYALWNLGGKKEKVRLEIPIFPPRLGKF